MVWKTFICKSPECVHDTHAIGRQFAIEMNETESYAVCPACQYMSFVEQVYPVTIEQPLP